MRSRFEGVGFTGKCVQLRVSQNRETLLLGV